jgi:hypothetical protein
LTRRSIPLCALLLTGALAGCGGSSGPSLSSFKSGFAADKAQFRKVGTDLGAAIQTASGKSDSALATEFASLSARATTQAAQLRKLQPPAKYKTAVGQLASSFDTVANDLHTISGAATSHDAATARSASATLVRDALKLQKIDKSVSGQLGL